MRAFAFRESVAAVWISGSVWTRQRGKSLPVENRSKILWSFNPYLSHYTELSRLVVSWFTFSRQILADQNKRSLCRPTQLSH